jgi:secondary thiamine-phosphate synthase enzyme
MKFIQEEIYVGPFERGFHLIDSQIIESIPGIREVSIGMFQVFIKHTSASLTLNENADPNVRQDFESHFDKMVPEDAPYYKHVSEGPDDMPAHIKASLLGSSVMIPISGGRLNLGTWQGIYLCEHREKASRRNLVITVWGE